MSLIQIVISLFAVFAISRVLLRFRRSEISWVHLLLWTLFWGAVILVTLRPETSSMIAGVLGVGRGADVIIYLALLLLFFLVFRLFAKHEDLERQITRVVRSGALRELEQHLRDQPGSGPRPPGPPS